MERYSPNPRDFTIGGTEQTVYQVQALNPPADVPVTFFNAGDDTVIKIRVQGSTVYMPVGVGSHIQFNPSGDVYATVDSGSGLLIVAAGVRAGSAGVTSTGTTSPTELAALAHAFTLKELAVLRLREAQLTNEYLARIIDEQLSERDLSSHVLD
jgi:hypothetical protein